jgi:hypothetical protein
LPLCLTTKRISLPAHIPLPCHTCRHRRLPGAVRLCLLRPEEATSCRDLGGSCHGSSQQGLGAVP